MHLLIKIYEASLYRRLFRKSNSTIWWNKDRLTSKHKVVKIEPWVDFYQEMTVMMKKRFDFQVWKEKEKSKEFVYSIREIIVKRHAKSFHKQIIEGPMLLKFRVFLYGVVSRLN